MSDGPCIVDASVLGHALGYIPKPVRNGNFPILEHARLAAPDGWLQLATTDLNVSLVQEVRRIDGGPMAPVTAPTRLLVDVLGKLRAGRVSFTRGAEAQVTIETDTGRTALLGLPARDFPKLPAPNPDALGVTCGPEFAEALAFVLPAASQDDSRPHLCGVYFDRDRLCATDGHRLHVAPCARLEGAEAPAFLMPLAAAKLLGKFARADCPFAFALGGITRDERLDRDTAGFFQMERAASQHRVALHIKLPDVLFPPIDQVIPKGSEGDVRFAADGSALARAFKQATIKERGIRMEVARDRLHLHAESPDDGEQRDTEIAVEGDGTMTLGIDPRYVAHALAGAGRVTVTLAGDRVPDETYRSPVRVDRDDDRFAIIMPMRI